MALPHVFTDASVTKTSTTIGIHCQSLNINKALTLSRPLDISTAESLAYLYAKKLITTPAHFFTDNKEVAAKYNINWIPREYNKKADALTRPAPIDINIGHYLLQFPLATKLKLICKLTGRDHGPIRRSSCPVTKLARLNHKLTLRLLHTLLTGKERPKAIKHILQDHKGITNKEFQSLLKGLT